MLEFAKRPGVLAMILLVSAVLTFIAKTTTAFEDVVSWWQLRSPTIIPAVRSFAPLLWGILLFYIATVLAVFLYREWQKSKSLQKRKRLGEIREIKEQVQIVGTIIMTHFSLEKEVSTPLEMHGPVDTLIRVLVESVAYEQRGELFGLATRLRTNDFSHWNYRIKPILDRLAEWDKYAEWELSGSPPFPMKDPLAIPAVREDGYVPPDPFGLNKYLYPPKE